MLSNVPEELRVNMPWMCCNIVQEPISLKPTKVPINPHTGKIASVTDPNSWGPFYLCESLRQYVSCISIVLYANCGYTCIDLDHSDDPVVQERTQNIIKVINSYTERSHSGKGYHIWVKGTVPAGRRRSNVEVYSESRHMVTTGDVYLNVPIRECQDLLMQLWEELGEEKTIIGTGIDKPQTCSDYDILAIASTAANGPHFIDWFEGRWGDYYPSQSECDFALINCISYYTQNRAQIARIFRSSVLGQRQKAKRQKYVDYMINRSFDNILPDIDFDTLRNNLEQQLAAKRQAVIPPETHQEPPQSVNEPQLMQVPAVTEISPDSAVHAASDISEYSNIQIPECVEYPAPEPVYHEKPKKKSKKHDEPKSKYSVPPGLMGEIAMFVFNSAPRPVPEIAIAAAMGLMSGVCGRSYNISGTGLNTYTFLLAKTGRGKESMRKGINKLLHEACKTVPAASMFMGPAKIASPEALVKYIAKSSNCFISVLGEFADTLKRMSNDSYNPQQQGVRIAMLDLYNQSGKDDVLGSLIYSDKDKNTEVTKAPAFSIIGEATPEKFYKYLTKDMIEEGLLPRCTIIEYLGDRVPANKQHATVMPTTQLVDKFSMLCAYALQLNNGNNVVQVGIDKEAQVIIDDFDTYCDKQVNSSDSAIGELWTRAHMKVLKLAGLLAVGVHYTNPVVNLECAEWAVKMIYDDVVNLIAKFDTGDIGASSVQNDQIVDIRKAFHKYLTSDWAELEKANGASLATHSIKVVPHSYVSSYCRQRSSFKNDRLGPIPALRTCLQSLLDSDEIRELTPMDKKTKGYSGNARLFMISGMKI